MVNEDIFWHKYNFKVRSVDVGGACQMRVISGMRAARAVCSRSMGIWAVGISDARQALTRRAGRMGVGVAAPAREAGDAKEAGGKSPRWGSSGEPEGWTGCCSYRLGSSEIGGEMRVFLGRIKVVGQSNGLGGINRRGQERPIGPGRPRGMAHW